MNLSENKKINYSDQNDLVDRILTLIRYRLEIKRINKDTTFTEDKKWGQQKDRPAFRIKVALNGNKRQQWKLTSIFFCE